MDSANILPFWTGPDLILSGGAALKDTEQCIAGLHCSAVQRTAMQCSGRRISPLLTGPAMDRESQRVTESDRESQSESHRGITSSRQGAS